jgi:hypothetical protein
METQNFIRLSELTRCVDSGISVPLEAAEVIRLMVELRSNDEILNHMKSRYSSPKSGWQNATKKRKFMGLMQNFILRNYKKEFSEFLKENRINIFNLDFEANRCNSTYARFVYIIFFREYMNMKPPIVIEDDLGKFS